MMNFTNTTIRKSFSKSASKTELIEEFLVGGTPMLYGARGTLTHPEVHYYQIKIGASTTIQQLRTYVETFENTPIMMGLYEQDDPFDLDGHPSKLIIDSDSLIVPPKWSDFLTYYFDPIKLSKGYYWLAIGSLSTSALFNLTSSIYPTSFLNRLVEPLNELKLPIKVDAMLCPYSSMIYMSMVGYACNS